MYDIYTSVRDELDIIEIVRQSPYNSIYEKNGYYYADLRDGTVTAATTMAELRYKLHFISKTEVLY